MECHNPLNRDVNTNRRESARAKSNENGTRSPAFSPEWRSQHPVPPWRRSASKSRLDFENTRGSERNNSGGSNPRLPRNERPDLTKQKEDRSEGILARESERKPSRTSRNILERTTQKAERPTRNMEASLEEAAPLEPWEIERAKNRANRLSWALALAAASPSTASPSSLSPSSISSPSSSSTSSPSSSSSSSSTASTSYSEADLSASMEELKVDVSAVVMHGRLAKLPSPSPLPSVSPGRRYIDPERQAEIDAQFGMSAEVDTGHMLELYELDSVDPALLLPMLGAHVEGLYQISENQCVAIFDNKVHAQELLRRNSFVAGKLQPLHPLRLQQYSHLLPKKFRPETTTKLARRIIFHNLSIRRERTPEEKARREKKPQKKSETDAWE